MLIVVFDVCGVCLNVIEVLDVVVSVNDVVMLYLFNS